MGESQNLGQCADDGDLAAAALRCGSDLNSTNKRADDLDNLRARCLVLQRVLQFRDLFAIKLRKIGVGNDSRAVLLSFQLSTNFSPASLQASQVIAHGAGVSVAA